MTSTEKNILITEIAKLDTQIAHLTSRIQYLQRYNSLTTGQIEGMLVKLHNQIDLSKQTRTRLNTFSQQKWCAITAKQDNTFYKGLLLAIPCSLIGGALISLNVSPLIAHPLTLAIPAWTAFCFIKDTTFGYPNSIPSLIQDTKASLTLSSSTSFKEELELMLLLKQNNIDPTHGDRLRLEKLLTQKCSAEKRLFALRNPSKTLLAPPEK